MNIRQIEIFRAVMEAGSVTRAAQRLRISQPSVSKYLRFLEDDLEVPLFERTGNRLAPTEEAKALHAQIDRSYRGIDQIARFAAGLKHHPAGEISVATMPMLARRWLPELLEPFLAEYPTASIALPIRSSRWIVDAVAAGQVDIGICLAAQDQTGLQQESLMRLPLVCVMPADHPLITLDVVTPADLAPHTLITLSNFDQWRLAVEMTLDAHAVRPARRVDTFTTEVACELVARDVGVAIVDLLTANDYRSRKVSWRRFAPANHFDIALMRSRHAGVSRLANSLLERIRNAAAHLTASLADAE